MIVRLRLIIDLISMYSRFVLVNGFVIRFFYLWLSGFLLSKEYYVVLYFVVFVIFFISESEERSICCISNS